MAYYKAEVEFTGISDLMFGRKTLSEKPDDITHAQHEERTWLEKAHLDRDRNLYLPAMALKFGLEGAGKWLRLQIPGKGKSEYTKRFAAGVMVMQNLELFVNGNRATAEDCEKAVLYVPSDGRRGGPKRVDRIFPVLRAPWQATAEVEVFDGLITQDVLYKHLIAFGRFNGFGSMRVGNGGINGICQVSRFEVAEVIDEQLAELEECFQ